MPRRRKARWIFAILAVLALVSTLALSFDHQPTYPFIEEFHGTQIGEPWKDTPHNAKRDPTVVVQYFAFQCNGGSIEPAIVRDLGKQLLYGISGRGVTSYKLTIPGAGVSLHDFNPGRTPPGTKSVVCVWRKANWLEEKLITFQTWVGN